MRQIRPTLLLSALFAAVPVLLAFPGCSKPVESPTASRLTVVQGHQQTAAVGTVLPTPIILRVLATDGSPLGKIPVSFNVIAGGGTVEPGTAISDASGEVKVKWTLGGQGVVQALGAGAPGVDGVNLTATGIIPSDLVVAQGNNQVAKAGAALPVQVVLRVTGNNNVPIPHQTVALSITGGGGSISPQTATTNASGEVAVRWTLGTQPGAQSAAAIAGSLGPILLSATAN
jgi:hypothetical protein